MAVLVTIGLVGSGKTTFAQKLRARVPSQYISPDVTLYQKDGTYVFTRERSAESWRLAYRKFGQYLTWTPHTMNNVAIIWDAMFLTAISRCAVVNTSKGMGQRVVGLFFDTPLDLCLERNSTCPRDRQIPEAKIRALSEQIEPPTRAEGFDDVIVVRPDNWEKVLSEAS